MASALTVVMPCSNQIETLPLALESLAQQTIPPEAFEVIVVDQASTDGSRAFVKGFAAPYELRLIEQEAKHGISVSRNAGAEAAASPLVLYLDADHIASAQVVEAHLATHAAHPGGIGCGRSLPYLPAYRSYVERVADPESGFDRGNYEGVMPYYEAFGHNLSLAVTTFQTIGPYDTRFKRWQDIEYACRANRLGVHFYNCPRAISYHNHPRTLRQRCEYAETSRMVPILLERYPDLRGAMPGLRDYEEIAWMQDGAAAIRRKLTARLYGLAPIRWSFYRTLLLLDRWRILPRLTKALYWRLMRGHGYAGFRRGQAQLRAGGAADGS